ncbi:TPA: antA/AntB antirepressor family protein [Haemophilus influenzae]|uniref:antA/AntB antirepressor family protein n=2 Tax=Haemophilus influenzae TaxID=727 RepID=UPI000ABED795|nr:antA/AntB antirepressor family protein [Haemophilus influenzae]
MTNSNLIPVFNGLIQNQPVQLCNARGLHAFVESKQEYATWIKNRINEYGFIQDEDYLVITERTNGRPRKEYHITLDMGKELGMVERNERGRQIRQYFIRCERTLKALQQPQQKTTVDDRAGLRNAISFLVNKKGLIYSEVYQLIHQQFGVEHIDELSQEQLSQAIKYIHFLTLNLDGLFKKGEEVIIPEYIFDAIMKHAKLAQKLAEKVICYQEKQFALLGIARHYRSNELTSRANSLLSEFSYFLHEGEKLLAQQIENPSLTQIKKISFNA